MTVDPLTLQLLIKDIPQLSVIPLSEIEIKELSGFTNKNYLVITAEKKYVLRISRKSTNKNIDRNNEAHNAEIAYQLGLTPKILWREIEGDIYTGMSLVDIVENSNSLAVDDFKNQRILDRIAKSLIVLQNSQNFFKGKLDHRDIENYLKQYFNLCTENQQKKLKNELKESLDKLKKVICIDRSFVASHIDLVAENFLKDGARIWQIDWEYSAMASPFWDIATVCNEAGFDESESCEFLEKVIADCQKSDFTCLRYYQSIVKTISLFWCLAYAV